MTKADYLKRLTPSRITDNPCINCLLETEERIAAGDFSGVNAGDQLWYFTYQTELEELKRVLREYKPENIIEVGSGSGRIIRTILDVLPGTRITGTEQNTRIFQFVKDRFSDDDTICIKQTDISDYLSNGSYYDIAICLMNTFGNINDPEVFKKIIDCAGYFVFSLYNQEFDEQRREMYEARGHSDFNFDGEKFCFQDPWIQGLVSRSYTKEEIGDLVKKAGAEIVELKEVGILYFCIAQKVKQS